MWNTNTYWFDVAVVSSLVLLGHIAFGRFEEHKPRWRRFLKVLIGVPLCVAPSVLLGRTALWALMGVIGVALIVVHGWWLPKHGVNGWTAEPRERYYELIGLDSTGKPRTKSG